MRKKVLIIVGGGIYGCIPARLLADLPRNLQGIDKVDCLSGCSIGGILAVAYAAGHTFGEMDEFFQTRAGDCFSRRFMARVNPLACPTYDSDSLEEVIKDVLGNTTMQDTRLRYPNLDLFIPGLNITDDKYKVFDNIDDLSVKLSTVARITSAAPSYFSGKSYHRKCYIDGGLIEVAPLMTAATALKGKRGVHFADMDVLMIGTGKDVDEKPLTPKEYNDLGLLGLATKVIVPYTTMANEMATVYWGNNMGFNSFTYFNPCKHNGELDDVDQIPEMVRQADRYSAEFTEVYRDWLYK